MALSALLKSVNRRWPAGVSRLYPVAATGAIAFIMLYILGDIGTWYGFMRPETGLIGLRVFSVVVVAWQGWRLARRWRWAPTPLDVALPLWLGAFLLSTLANADQAFRSAGGLWFAGLYVVAWYMIQDALANGLIRPLYLINGLVVAGAFILLDAFSDWSRFYEAWLAGTWRVTSTLANANILGALVVLLVPLGMGKVFTTRGIWRVLAVLYMLLAITVTYVSGSRGAWLGCLAAIGFVLWLRLPRFGSIAALAAIPIGILLFSVRGDVGRFDLYGHALDLFRAAPLTGQGLFTFRRPDIGTTGVMHLHAHNAFLHVGAELGIVGLVALGVTLWSLGTLIWRRTRDVVGFGAEMPWWIAALVATAAHQMVDFPIMTVAIALSVIVVLCAVTATPAPLPSGDATDEVPDTARRKHVLPALLVGGLALLLFLTAITIGYLPGRLI